MRMARSVASSLASTDTGVGLESTVDQTVEGTARPKANRRKLDPKADELHPLFEEFFAGFEDLDPEDPESQERLLVGFGAMMDIAVPVSKPRIPSPKSIVGSASMA